MQLRALQAILCELTHRCPLQCLYCSNPQQLTSKALELQMEQWLALIEQAAEMKVQQLHFSGGEPTLYPGYISLIEYANSLGLYTNLITSGYHLKEQEIQALKAVGLNHMQVSFQGPSSDYDVKLSKARNAFDKKIATVQWARKNKIAVTINFVITDQNAGDTEKMLHLAYALGVNRVECAHVQFQGWAYLNRYYLHTSEEQIKNAQAAIERAKIEYRGKMTIDWVGSDWHQRKAKPCMEGWGQKYMIVNPAGQALPCHLATLHAGLQFENIAQTRLADIWENSAAFQRYRSEENLPEKCRNCPGRKDDFGGCRCQALQFTGSASNIDPACPKADADTIFVKQGAPEKRVYWRRFENDKKDA